MNVKFSILIPAYKRRFLKDCIDSILCQTYKDFELVIVNDASPEDLDSVIKTFNDERIRYFVNEKNCGAVKVVDNWNKCLEYSHGDFVICMGDDDKLDARALETYTKFIEKYPSVDVFHTPSVIIDGEGHGISVTMKRAEYESAFSYIKHRLYGEDQYIGDYCFKRSKLDEIGGFVMIPLAWGSDDLTALYCAGKNGVVNLDTPVFYYRYNSSTISNTGNIRIKMEAIALMEKKLKEFIEENKGKNALEDLERAAAIHKLENYWFLKKAFTLSEDIKENRFRTFRWLSKRQHFNLGIKHIIGGFVLTFRHN